MHNGIQGKGYPGGHFMAFRIASFLRLTQVRMFRGLLRHIIFQNHCKE